MLPENVSVLSVQCEGVSRYHTGAGQTSSKHVIKDMRNYVGLGSTNSSHKTRPDFFYPAVVFTILISIKYKLFQSMND